MARWDEVFNRVAKLRPDEPTLWIGRGDYHLLCSQWSKAAADFAKVIQSRPASSDESGEYAFLLLLLDDTKGYQQFCQDLIAHADDPEDDSAAFQMVRTFAAGPEDAVDASHLLQWANQAVEGASNHPWNWHGLGLVQYRAGKYALAIEALRKSNVNWKVPEMAQNWLVLAMAHQRLGQVDDAHRCLETAREQIEQVQPNKPDEPVRRADHSELPPTDWIEMNTLLREAEALIEPEKFAKKLPQNQ